MAVIMANKYDGGKRGYLKTIERKTRCDQRNKVRTLNWNDWSRVPDDLTYLTAFLIATTLSFTSARPSLTIMFSTYAQQHICNNSLSLIRVLGISCLQASVNKRSGSLSLPLALSTVTMNTFSIPQSARHWLRFSAMVSPLWSVTCLKLNPFLHIPVSINPMRCDYHVAVGWCRSCPNVSG